MHEAEAECSDDDDYWDAMAGGGPAGADDGESGDEETATAEGMHVAYDTEDGWLDAHTTLETSSLQVLSEDNRLWRQLSLSTGPNDLSWSVTSGTVIRVSTTSQQECLCAWLRDRVSVSLTHWVGQLQHRTGGRERFDENVLDDLFFKSSPKVQEAVMKYALHPGRHDIQCPVVSLVL